MEQNETKVEYPRTVIIDNSKLKDLLVQKKDANFTLIELSEEIEALEKELNDLNAKMLEEEKKIDTSDLFEESKVITDQFNEVVKKMDEIKKRITARMVGATPKELVEEYETKKKTKEDKEQERNKIGLKIQKFNDKIIPLGRKLMKPLLQNKYEDYDSLRIENGEIVGTIFNHQVDWEAAFEKRKIKA